jgi:hypothetical protein
MNVHLYVTPWTTVGVYICYRPVIHMRLLIFLPHIHMLHLPEGLCAILFNESNTSTTTNPFPILQG